MINTYMHDDWSVLCPGVLNHAQLQIGPSRFTIRTLGDILFLPSPNFQDGIDTLLMALIPWIHCSPQTLKAFVTWMALLLHRALPTRSAPVNAAMCYRDGEILWHMLGFFATNFIAHAATVPVLSTSCQASFPG
ncbi:hypothetical protein AcW1_007475 [Taiwanofungus camphoratus]|nr:hypothetical protein AcV5_007805 [Antrodia cinnamomea]KAI0953190.1 hypothetical protein AcW1_007475 [Antrodia cinnamomea]